MVSKELQDICWRVWKCVNKWVQNNALINSETMCGACAIVSYALYKTLIKKGFTPNFILIENKKGSAHCFVELDGKVFDLSAKQFRQMGQRQADILVAEKEKYIKTIPKLKKYIKVFKDKDAIDHINKEWIGQNPIEYRSKINSLVRRLAA